MFNPFLCPEEAAEFLRVKVSTLYRWVHQRKIPFRKHGRKLVFSMQDLIDWSNANSQEPIDYDLE